MIFPEKNKQNPKTEQDNPTESSQQKGQESPLIADPWDDLMELWDETDNEDFSPPENELTQRFF
ncbi:MAG: hypothetical protein F6K03_11640, partial [Kamptonema sp. SIO4C4]|nr:hypothetical protein [Kamptonema sp. SIO4C4]